MYIYFELDIWNQIFIIDINLTNPRPITKWFKRYTRFVIAFGLAVDIGIMKD